MKFPISRDPPEGGTSTSLHRGKRTPSFQFLGIPPKGEPDNAKFKFTLWTRFQFLGIPPKGELPYKGGYMYKLAGVSNF